MVHAPGSRMQARKYWLRHAPAAPGRIVVDAGAARALTAGRASLLPGGVVGAEGEFHRGDMVEIVDAEQRAIARGLSQYGAVEVRRLSGHHSREIAALLGYSYGGEVVHRDDMATVGTTESAA
jgi:glutamate 5-kinase